MKKKNSTPTPYDATFRQFLTQPDIVRDFLALHLPPELRESFVRELARRVPQHGNVTA